MYYEIEKCKFCCREYRKDSENGYWHLKTHLTKNEAGIADQCDNQFCKCPKVKPNKEE